jgi:two-component system KDP operon response regulator KdpE
MPFCVHFSVTLNQQEGLVMRPDQPAVSSGELAGNQKAKVLIVDDADAVRQFLRTSLSAHGYEVHQAAAGEDAITKAIDLRPDLIILDLGFPGMDGIEVTQRIREWTQTPILVLGVQNQDTDKIEALDAGADDYMTKPFSVGELTARLRAAMRHTRREKPKSVFTNGRLAVDMNANTVYCDGAVLQLTPTEYDLLKLLVQNAGRVLTHERMLREVRGAEFESDTHLLHVHVSNLRHKIETDPSHPQYIMTVPGIGYRFKPGPSEA